MALFSFSALGLVAFPSGSPVAGAPTAPPNNTFEIAITGNTVVAPGGTLTFEGTCWAIGFGPAQEASIHGYRVVGPGIDPFNFEITMNVNQSTGAVTGTITVPGNAPNGDYRLAIVCSTQDQLLGWTETPFTVDGPLITTTTTSSTTSSSTTTPSDLA